MTDKKLQIRNSTAEFLVFTAQSGQQSIEVRYEDETIWLSQKLLATLFDVDVRTVSEHLKNIFQSGELQEDSVIRKFRNTAADGKSYQTQFYNLDAIISVGYRVNSVRATQFRQWATQVLREFAIKGYVLDKKRLENGAFLGEDYYERLLEEIREIRLSERRFYQKITDIYATSVDYNQDAPTTRDFFAKVQNKLHFAIHGRTAAEIVLQRANGSKDHMGLTSWENSPDGKILKTDASIAKNYLTKEEMESLGRIVNAYLDLSEDRARRRIPMTMEDWAKRLDLFLKFDEREILQDKGKVTAEIARAHAESEFEKYRIVQDRLFESDFDRMIKQLEDKKLSKIQWEYDLVERPFCEQLQAMGWSWTPGDVDVPELTERGSFREVVLSDRLVSALARINLRDGDPWLDDNRVAKSIRDLERTAGHRLMEVNQAATELLLRGTVVDGLPDWDNGRPQPIRYIDFEHPENNDFLVINQFKVELTSGRGHVIPDAVLFVNGIPLVVTEFKSPGIENPLQEAINQLLRYSNQRRELFPTLFADNEGVEKLFHTNQLLIASDFFEARAATIGAPPEAYLEWADTSPVPLSTVAEELGIISGDVGANNYSPLLEEAGNELLAIGPEQSECVGTPLFFRRQEQRPEDLRKAQGAALQSQQVLTAGMLRPAHLLDLIRNFTVFQQVDGKTRKVVARYQQFRAMQKVVLRLQEGRTRSQGAERDERGGIIWHTQGSGKRLSMVFLVRKMRTLERLKQFKIVAVTDRTDLEGQLRETARLSGEAVRPTDRERGPRESPTALTQRILSETTPDIVFAMLQKYQDVDRQAKGDEKVAMTIVRQEKKPGKDEPVVGKEVTFKESIRFEEFPVLNESEAILVLVDEAHRSHTRSLHRNLRRALPNAAIIGFTGTPILSKEKTETREIFGDFIDKYLLQDAELDGATVPILYEGRTADGLVKDAPSLDKLFEDMFRTYSEKELAVIKAKYGTEGDVLEAPLLIEKKARDMLRHYVEVVLPEGFKAQVVATSRRAAVSYREKLLAAREELVRDMEEIPAATRALPDEKIEQLDRQTRFLVRAYPLLPLIQALDVAVVISGDHNDPESWWDWANKGKQDEYTTHFKRKLAFERTEKTDPLAMLVVNNMLLTGFDAPVEQVMYLDRKVVAHDLLQAVARVNRTCGRKKCGYVVDYIGVARHLNEALKEYDGEDTEGALIDINVELPKLIDRRNRSVAVFTDRSITNLQTEVEACVDLLANLKIRAEFINKLRLFYETLNILEHRPEVPNDVFRDAKLLGFINKVAANLYRDPALNLLGVAEKVKALIDAHISARGVDPKIPPTTITDAEFEKVLQAQKGSRARAAQMQHAARYHIIGFSHQNPAFARKMSEKLEEILKRFKDDWDALEKELRKFIDELRQGDRNDFPDLGPQVQVPFVRLILEACSEGRQLDETQRKAAIRTTLDIVERIRQEVAKVGFWKNSDQRELLTRHLVRDLNASGVCLPGKERDIAQRLVALAKENHVNLVKK